jgi:hypothetical protein
MKAAKMDETPIGLETFQGWSKLEPNEQNRLTVETQALERAAEAYEMSNLEIGEHLDNINKVLNPKRQFNKWLLWWLKSRKKGKSRSWAYQAMAEYQAIKKDIPKPVLDAAKAAGTRINPLIYAKHPAPKTSDPGQIQKYLDSLKTTRLEVVSSPDQLLKECVNFVGTRWEKLPNNSKARTAFMRALIGMLLAKFGVASELSFAPMAIPDTFRAKRGRPLSKAA